MDEAIMVPKRSPAKRKRGNPAFVATELQRILTKILAAAGHTQKAIADRLGVSVDTLQRHLKDEFDEGRDFANSSVGEVLLGQAMTGDVKAIAEWFDRRGGPDWRRRTASEQSGPGGGPIRISAEPPRRDLSMLTEEELENWERLTARIESNDRAAD
jgi:DNA-binding CsgD family transcriptional regulator